MGRRRSRNASKPALPSTLPSAVPLAVPAPEELNADEKMTVVWLKYTMVGVSTALTGWNLSLLQEKTLAARNKKFLIPNFFVYTLFGILSTGLAHSHGESRAWFPAVSFLALLHFEYMVCMMFYELHETTGTSWNDLGPVLAGAVTSLAVIWSVVTSPDWWAKRIVPHHHPRLQE